MAVVVASSSVAPITGQQGSCLPQLQPYRREGLQHPWWPTLWRRTLDSLGPPTNARSWAREVCHHVTAPHSPASLPQHVLSPSCR